MRESDGGHGGGRVDAHSRGAFGLLIAAQAAHSAEEYAYRLFDVFPPARFVSLLASRDPATGFALVNTGIVVFGFWCYFVGVRSGHSVGRAIGWSWACLELANGVGHLLLAGARSGYFPGLATAPLLIGASSYLAFRLLKQS
jgi:hypothetical protein